MGNINQLRELRAAQQRKRTLCQIDRQISHALQIAVDLDRRGEETQIARHRLVQGEQPCGHLVDFDVEIVDTFLGLPDTAAQPVVAFHQRANAVVDGSLHQAAHFEQLVLQFAEF